MSSFFKVTELILKFVFFSAFNVFLTDLKKKFSLIILESVFQISNL